MTGAIESHIERFLLDSIDTVPHLEALLLIFRSPQVAWTVEDLAARIYVNERQAHGILEDLARRTLIARVEQAPVHSSTRYQYTAKSEAQTELLEEVARAYRTQLVQVTRFIHSNASGSVRDFARAFRLKDND